MESRDQQNNIPLSLLSLSFYLFLSMYPPHTAWFHIQAAKVVNVMAAFGRHTNSSNNNSDTKTTYILMSRSTPKFPNNIRKKEKINKNKQTKKFVE